jgi:hypothetical protein
MPGRNKTSFLRYKNKYNYKNRIKAQIPEVWVGFWPYLQIVKLSKTSFQSHSSLILTENRRRKKTVYEIDTGSIESRVVAAVDGDIADVNPVQKLIPLRHVSYREVNSMHTSIK